MAKSGFRSKGHKGKAMANPHRVSPMEQSYESSTRRQTMLGLIDLLSELRENSALEHGGASTAVPSIEEEDLTLSVDEKLSNRGAEQFFKFEKRLERFDAELRDFVIATRPLGSSAGIRSSAFKLRERLTKVLFLFRENAANLYPRKVTRQPRDVVVNPSFMARRSHWAHVPIAKLVLEDCLEPDTLPAQLEDFAKDIVTFLNCLSEFPGFADGALGQSLRGFEGDLKYWASCLAEYKNQFRSPPVQRYTHDLIPEIGDQIDDITGALSELTEIDVLTVQLHQQHVATTLSNLSTVSALFSIVTVASVQFSHGLIATMLSDAVNAFWFASLVFSITATANSLLACTWKQTVYRSPGHMVPWWILVWLKKTPLVFLVISIACYLVGLVLFMYSSGQGVATSTIITTLAGASSFGLAVVSAWFISERVIFIRHRGQKWLSEVLLEMMNKLANNRMVRAVRICFRWCRMRIASAQRYLATKTRTPSEMLPTSNIPPPRERRVEPRPPPYLQPHSTASTPEPTMPLSVASRSRASDLGRTSSTTLFSGSHGSDFGRTASSATVFVPGSSQEYVDAESSARSSKP